MAAKRKNLYLYLALACFLVIILIFIFDGYMGVYDTVTVNTGEYEEQIEADQWQQDEKYMRFPSVGVGQGGKVSFIYEVDNRWFSAYSDNVAVSAWHNNEKVLDLLSAPLSVKPFTKGRLEWVVDTAQVLPADVTLERNYQFTVMIKRGDIERSIIVNIQPAGSPLKVIPAPPRD